MLEKLVESSLPSLNAMLMEDTRILLPPDVVVTGTIEKENPLCFCGFSLVEILKLFDKTSIRSV